MVAFLQKLWNNKIFRFGCIGLINTLTDISILDFLVFAYKIKIIEANLISASISICFSYFWNHYLVFRHKKKVSLLLFIKFFIITGAGIILIQSMVIYGFEHIISIKFVMETLGTSKLISDLIRTNGIKIIAVLSSMVWNFILYSFTVFIEIKDEGVVPY